MSEERREINPKWSHVSVLDELLIQVLHLNNLDFPLELQFCDYFCELGYIP